jgi:hypothetical protein
MSVGMQLSRTRYALVALLCRWAHGPSTGNEHYAYRPSPTISPTDPVPRGSLASAALPADCGWALVCAFGLPCQGRALAYTIAY